MIKNLFILIRPLNVTIAALTIIIGAALSPHFYFYSGLYLAVFSVALITGAANIVNDIFDIEIDKINKPSRVLANGNLSLKTAWVSYIVLNITALICAWNINLPMFLIALLSIIFLFLYSYYFKSTIIAGNLLVSFMGGMAFIYATLSVNDFRSGTIPSVFAFLFHFGREILKDIEDMPGDMAKNVITYPGKFGKTCSFVLINFIFFLLTCFLMLPQVLNSFNVYYIYIVLIGVIPVLIFTSVLIWFKNDTATLKKISMLLKVDMIIGLMALFFGMNLQV